LSQRDGRPENLDHILFMAISIAWNSALPSPTRLAVHVGIISIAITAKVILFVGHCVQLAAPDEGSGRARTSDEGIGYRGILSQEWMNGLTSGIHVVIIAIIVLQQMLLNSGVCIP
jgi:hypothetical protein